MILKCEIWSQFISKKKKNMVSILVKRYGLNVHSQYIGHFTNLNACGIWKESDRVQVFKKKFHTYTLSIYLKTVYFTEIKIFFATNTIDKNKTNWYNILYSGCNGAHSKPIIAPKPVDFLFS